MRVEEDVRVERVNLRDPDNLELAKRLGAVGSELVRLWCAGEPQEKDEEGQRPVLVSTDDVDRMGDIVEPQGMDLSAYRKNPVVLWAHDYTLPPIGSAMWIKRAEHGILAKVRWASTEFAQQIKLLYDEGHLRAWSIGFIPKAAEDIEHKEGEEIRRGRRYTKAELLEFSAVPVPANPNALSLALQKGLPISKDLREMLLRSSKTTVIVQGDESPLIDLGELPTDRIELEQTLTDEEAQRTLYDKAEGDQPPTVVQTLIFDKAVFKTAEEAKKWAREHEFRADKVDETDESWRLRQRDPGDFEEGSFRTITLTKGVQAVVGHLKKSAGCAECAALREQIGALTRRAETADADWQTSEQALSDAKAKIEGLTKAQDTTVRIDMDAIRRGMDATGIKVAGADVTKEELRALVTEVFDGLIRKHTGVVSR